VFGRDFGTVRFEGVELVRIDVPFRQAVGTGAGVHRVRPLLFVRVLAGGGEGWGECAALGQGTAVDPPIELVTDALVERGIARLAVASARRGGVLPPASALPQLFGSSAVDRHLAAVLEMAVADLELRREGRSLASSLGTAPGFASQPVGAVVGIPADRDVDALRAAVDAAVASGAARVRIKVEPGWCTRPVRAVRADHPDLVLQVDANGTFRLADDDVAELRSLERFDVRCVEQPLPAADLVALGELARRLAVPVCLDESLSSTQRVRDALRNGACAVACLKPARLGGVRAARAAHAACVAAGVPAFVGGFFEAGLGRTSNLALAARFSQDAAGLVGDLDAPAGYLVEDPCGYPPVVRGRVAVPDAPGVGPAPDPGVLSRYAARRRWYPAGGVAT
jgi:O-succinylbenzoate synthase